MIKQITEQLELPLERLEVQMTLACMRVARQVKRVVPNIPESLQLLLPLEARKNGVWQRIKQWVMNKGRKLGKWLNQRALC